MNDPLLDQAKELSIKQGYVSMSYIQRVMRVGYTRASRLVDLMIEQEFCEAEYVEGKGYRALKIDLTKYAPVVVDVATGAPTLSGLFNCVVCGEEKCLQPGICAGCLTMPTE